jgi:glycerol uptake facilitator-like aquaporin
VGIAIAATFYGSGAHLNPTVTGLITIFAKIRWTRILLYLASAFGSAALIGGLWRLGALFFPLPAFGLDHADLAAVIGKEALATLCLLSYLAIFVFLERGILTIGAVPVFLSLIQLTALGGADMNPAVTLGWFVVGKYDVAGLGAHLLGEAIAIGALLVVGHALRTLRRRVVAERHGALRNQ